MTPITVIPVEGRRDLLRFIRMPRSLYPPESLWVSPLDLERRKFLDPRKNPFFKIAEVRCFLASRGGRDVGRIAAILNHHYNDLRPPMGFWGFFDAVDDPEVSAALFREAEGWLREKGMTVLQGPYSPSSNHECGLLVSGSDRPPRILMPYNHPYYAALVEREGYRKAQDLVAYEYDVDGAVPDRLRHALEVLAKRGKFEVRKMNLRKFDEEIARFQKVYNEGWLDNYGFVPFTDDEVEWMARDLRPIVTPEMCQFAEVDGEVAGMMLLVPDVNQAMKPLRGKLLPFGWWKLLRGLKRVDAMRALVMGTRPGFRHLGIDYAFYSEGLKVALARKYRTIELSWVLEQNVALLRPLMRLNARETKRYRLYEKKLP